MIKVEIYIPTDSRFPPPVMEKEFVLSEDRERHVWQGRALSLDEFHEVADKILRKKNYYKRPTVRIFEVEEEKPEKQAKKQKSKSPKAKDDDVLPIQEEVDV